MAYEQFACVIYLDDFVGTEYFWPDERSGALWFWTL